MNWYLYIGCRVTRPDRLPPDMYRVSITVQSSNARDCGHSSSGVPCSGSLRLWNENPGQYLTWRTDQTVSCRPQPSCFVPFSHMRRSLGFPYRHSLLRTPRTSSHLSCYCFFVGIAIVDRPLYGELLRSVSSGYRLSSIYCPHFRFHLQTATTSAGALESLRHPIYFSWHGRLLESDAPLRSKDGTSDSLGWGGRHT